MNLFEVLRRDHDELRKLLALLARTHGDTERRTTLFRQLKSKWSAHSQAEEVSLYAQLGQLEGESHGADSAQGREGHEEACQLVKDLETTNVADQSWSRRFERFKQHVLRQMAHEERIVFQEAGKRFSRAQRTELARTHEAHRDRRLG